MKCERCGKEHDGSFGSGRFCSKSCANARIMSTETKNKIGSAIAKPKKHCKLCNSIIKKNNKTGYCAYCLRTSKECSEIRSNLGKIASHSVKNHKKKNKEYYDNFIPSINKIDYVYKTHNDREIQKWIDYVLSKNIIIPEHSIRQSQSYYVLTNSHKHTSGTHFEFEHNYIMNIVLDKNLTKNNTVHHIDNNGLNNSLDNLLVFENNADHVRFHHSKNAWLTYNESTHKFSTIIKK